MRNHNLSLGRGAVRSALGAVSSLCSKISAAFDKAWEIEVDLIYRCGVGPLSLD